jgi:hypothetical protein
MQVKENERGSDEVLLIGQLNNEESCGILQVFK